MMISAEELAELKRTFAEWWISFPNEPFKAACMVFPDPKETGNRIIAAHDWPNDPQVILFRKQILRDEKQAKNYLPCKADLIADLYAIASNPMNDAAARIKALDTIAHMDGHSNRGGNININNNNGNKVLRADNVMLVPDYGSDAEWEDSLILQQQKLIAVDIDVPNDNSDS